MFHTGIQPGPYPLIYIFVKNMHYIFVLQRVCALMKLGQVLN